MKCQKMKKYFYIGLSAFMSLYLSLCSCIGSYASDSTNSGANNTMSASNWLQRYWYAGSRWICDKYVVGSDAIFGTFADFLSWSVNEYGEQWMDDKEVTIIQNLGEQEQYIVPDDVQEAVQEYVQYNILQNPLGYTECYINSYNFLSPENMQSYVQWKSVQTLVEKYGPCIVSPNYNYSQWYVTVLDREHLNYVGSTLSGSFSNVHLYYDWSNYTGSVTTYTVYANGGASSSTTNMNANLTVYNGNSPPASYSYVFSNYEKNELVYVFSTLNSLKNYNAGFAQPYYLTSEGLNADDWSANSGICNSGTMNNSGNYYSTVTNGVGSNWTPDQILALVDKVTSANGGSGGSSDSDKDTSKMWDRIGNAIGNLIDGIITVFTTIIEKLSDALLSIIHLLTGYTDDNGVVHEGLFTRLTSLVNTGFSNFISSIFSWLPDEIVTLLSATLVFGIFFGIFKMLRR